MNASFVFLSFCVFGINYILGILLTGELLYGRKKKDKHYCFEDTLLYDLCDTLLADEEVLQSKDIMNSVDGCDASKEYQKG